MILRFLLGLELRVGRTVSQRFTGTSDRESVVVGLSFVQALSISGILSIRCAACSSAHMSTPAKASRGTKRKSAAVSRTTSTASTADSKAAGNYDTLRPHTRAGVQPFDVVIMWFQCVRFHRFVYFVCYVWCVQVLM